MYCVKCVIFVSVKTHHRGCYDHNGVPARGSWGAPGALHDVGPFIWQCHPSAGSGAQEKT